MRFLAGTSRAQLEANRNSMAITRILASPDGDGDEHTQLQQPQPAHPPQPMHQHTLSDASTATVDIEAWTVAALESLSIAPIARGTGSALSIPLDVGHPDARHGLAGAGDDGRSSAAAAAVAAASEMKLRGVAFAGDAAYGASVAPPRRPPSRRDSMRKREALLKGKEGSRQRRRWENGNRPLPLPIYQHLLPASPTYLPLCVHTNVKSSLPR